MWSGTSLGVNGAAGSPPHAKARSNHGANRKGTLLDARLTGSSEMVAYPLVAVTVRIVILQVPRMIVKRCIASDVVCD